MIHFLFNQFKRLSVAEVQSFFIFISNCSYQSISFGIWVTRAQLLLHVVYLYVFNGLLFCSMFSVYSYKSKLKTHFTEVQNKVIKAFHLFENQKRESEKKKQGRMNKKTVTHTSIQERDSELLVQNVNML